MDVPCPPGQELVNFSLRYTTRGPFEEVDDVLPERDIVEVAIN